jgi:hypothetical protein
MEKSMGYTRDYSDLSSETKADSAIEDVKDWLGKKDFAQMVANLRGEHGIMPKQWAYMSLMMAGVQGYPATAMVERYWKAE